MIYLKVISLFVCLWFTPVNIVNAIRGNDIEWYEALIMACGWTAFIFLMGWLPS